ncbi:MAG: NfeD family protein, partial [Clostridiales bacterium]|nr:NfeD family protein [Clostridiales bacterium]
MGTIPMWLFWIILMVVFLVIEAAAMGLSTIWCAVGCLIAAILAALGVDLWIQILVMVLVSVALFIMFIVWIKPNMKDIKKVDKEPTNADRLIGQEGIVTEDIDPIEGKGQIKVMGQIWSAA